MRLHHDAAVVSLHFSPDGARLVTATTYDGFTVWETASGVPLHNYPGAGNGVTEVLLLPDGRHLFEAAVAFGESALVDLQAERETTTFEMIQAECAAWVPGDRGILIASWDDHLCGAAQLLDRDDLHICHTYQTGIEGRIGRVAVSEDGAHFLIGQACFSVATGSMSADRAFLLETDSGVLKQTFCGPSTLHDLVFAPGEQYIVGCTESGLWWWDAYPDGGRGWTVPRYFWVHCKSCLCLFACRCPPAVGRRLRGWNRCGMALARYSRAVPLSRPHGARQPDRVRSRWSSGSECQ